MDTQVRYLPKALRIAYIANYQGADLIQQRNIKRNRALAGSHKIELISEILGNQGHSVTVFSSGISAERSGRFYPSFKSITSFKQKNIPVIYGPTLDFPVITWPLTIFGLKKHLAMAHRLHHFDLILIYNFHPVDVLVGLYAAKKYKLPIVLEYEDDATVDVYGKYSIRAAITHLMRNVLRHHIKGIIAVSPELASQIPTDNFTVVRGIVDDDLIKTTICNTNMNMKEKPKVLFAGTIQHSKGVDILLRAWQQYGFSDVELHILGDGPDKSQLELKYSQTNIHFHGFINREKFVFLLSSSTICVNPQRAGIIKPGHVFPFKLIEYIAAGKPVVSARMGKIEPEIEKAIIYTRDESPLELGRVIHECLHNIEKYNNFAAEARSWVLENYSRDVVGKKIEKVLYRALNETAQDCS